PRPAATRGEAGPAAGHRPDRVVLLALLGVGEHRVRLPDVLEPALGCGVARVAVGVEVTRELAVRRLDRGVVGVLGDAEDLVEVLLEPVLPGHRASPPSSLSRVSSCGAGRTSRCGRRWAVVTRGWSPPRGRP